MWYLGNSSSQDDQEEYNQQNKKLALSNSLSNSYNSKESMQIDDFISQSLIPQNVHESTTKDIHYNNTEDKIDQLKSKIRNPSDEEDLFNLELNNEDDIKKKILLPPVLTTQEEQILLERKQMSSLLSESHCYNLIPESGKIVVLDIALAVKSAFLALEENNIKSAPLWDSSAQDYVGIITVTDFIEILLHFHKVPNINLFEELEKHQIKTWRDIIATDRPTATLIYIDPEDTLYSACKVLLKYRIHRLPIIDRAESNTILHIITHYRILLFFLEKLVEKPSFFSCSIGSLGIGTHKNVVTILKDTPLSVVLKLLAERKISAVPVVDENGSVIDVYSKSDVTALVKQVTVMNFLDKSVGEILAEKRSERHKIYTCYKTESLDEVLKRLVETKVYRLICVDSTNRVEGIISQSDILQFFLT